MITWENLKLWLKDELVSSLPYNLKAPQACSIKTDSRNIENSQWFLPLIGKNFNAHSFIDNLLSTNKIAGAFCEQQYLQNISPQQQKKLIIIKNSLHTYQLIAQEWKKTLPNLTSLAHTGSLGKTTCKAMCSLILAENAETLAFDGNYNNEIGIPQTLLKLTPSHRFACFELGACKIGDIRFLNQLVNPDLACCLNVNSSHLETFGSKENIYKTKTEIFEFVSNKNKINLVYGDDLVLLKKAKKISPNVISFGTKKENDCQLLSSATSNDSMTVNMRIFKYPLTIQLPCAHPSYPINALAAAAMAYSVTKNLDSIVKGLSKFTGVQSHYHVCHYQNTILVDDSYNASLESTLLGLQSIDSSFPSQKKILILGDILEAGDLTIPIHQKIGQQCSTVLNLKKIITVGKYSQIISQHAQKNGVSAKKIIHFSKVEELLEKNILDLNDPQLIYLKGSSKISLNKVANYVKNNT
jgi:UDP-N-acetylmuramoyl-tripeptide--D-alanyl-D-alanine ligase